LAIIVFAITPLSIARNGRADVGQGREDPWAERATA
jgi:hypothetical protein